MELPALAFSPRPDIRLKAAVGGLSEACGDPRLDAVLGEIELRVEVELAKAGLR